MNIDGVSGTNQLPSVHLPLAAKSLHIYGHTLTCKSLLSFLCSIYTWNPSHMYLVMHLSHAGVVPT